MCTAPTGNICSGGGSGRRLFFLTRWFTLCIIARVAACVSELVHLDLDARSTAAFGVSHILSALTVTNRELRALALAEKEITPEQYE